MQHKWLFVLVVLCAVFLTQLDAQSDETKEKIQEKRKSIKNLISKIRSKLDKKKSGKLVMEKSVSRPMKMVAAQIECAASQIKGVDACCPSLNKTLNLALDVSGCATDLKAMLELGRGQPLPQDHLQYTLHLLQDLDTNKLTFASLDKSVKEQICVSECLIRKLRSNSRQKESRQHKKIAQSTHELFKESFDDCKKFTKGYESTKVTFDSRTCGVSAYLQLQCAIRKSVLPCADYKSSNDLCEHKREQLTFCNPLKF